MEDGPVLGHGPGQLANRPVGMPGGRVVRSRRRESCPRHAASIKSGVCPRAGQGGRAERDQRQGGPWAVWVSAPLPRPSSVPQRRAHPTAPRPCVRPDESFISGESSSAVQRYAMLCCAVPQRW